MATSRLDAVYRSFLITKFFTKGWGQPENLRRLFEFRKTVSNRDECFKLVERDYPVNITKEETSGDCKLVEGHFLTPLERYLPGIVPPVARQAHFQAVIPLKWAQPDYRPMCLHLAGTGDHYFWRRRQLMVKPLMKEAGIGGVILENPFYGLRKPSDQVRSSLHNVSDIFVMGGCLVLESLVLFHWCERNNLGPLGVTGLSMGGHMASLAATNWPKPLVLVPCLSWSTASAVFLQGVMSRSINWDLLEDQYLSDGVYREKLSKMVTVIDEAFLAGKKFAKKVSQSVNTSIKEITNMAGQVATNKETHISENTKDKEKSNAEISMNNISNTDNVVPQDNAKKDDAEVSIKNNRQQDFEKFKMELEILSREGTISQSLYSKLSSNEKFELDSRDIKELNKLNKKDFLSYFMKKYKIGLQDNKFNSSVSSDKTDPIAPNAQTLMRELITEVHNLKQHTKTETQKPERLDSISQEFEKINRELENAVGKYTINSNRTRKNFDEATANEKAIAENAAKKIDSRQGSKVEKKSRNITEISTDILSSLSFGSKSSGRKIDISKIHWRDREALQFMRGVMDECTHLSNFTVPYDTSLIIAVCAKHDAYVPRDDVGTLEEIWPGAEVRYVDAGHVSAYLLHQSMFRSCIIEAFERSKKKWKDGQHIV